MFVRSLAVLALAAAAMVPLVAQGSAPQVTVAPVAAEPLIGQWRVDLTATPAEGTAGRYYTDMVIESVQGEAIHNMPAKLKGRRN